MKTRNGLSYPIQRKVESYLHEVLRIIKEGPTSTDTIVTYIDDFTDGKVAAELSKELGQTITAANVKGLRSQMFGKLRVSPVPPAPPVTEVSDDLKMRVMALEEMIRFIIPCCLNTAERDHLNGMARAYPVLDPDRPF